MQKSFVKSSSRVLFELPRTTKVLGKMDTFVRELFSLVYPPNEAQIPNSFGLFLDSLRFMPAHSTLSPKLQSERRLRCSEPFIVFGFFS